MSEEQNLFEGPTAVAAPDSNEDNNSENDGAGSGSGVSKSRRRRRKRKSRSTPGAASQPATEGQADAVSGSAGASIEMAASAEAPGSVETQPAVQSSSQGSGQPNRSNNQRQHTNNPQQGQGQGQGNARRKKKKFRRAGETGGQQQRPEPGNSLQGSNSATNGAGRRNRKQQGGGSRGPRAFVGPMDHSYREANGNFADSPASTIQLQGNGHGRQNSNGHRNGRHFNEDRLPPELMHHYRPVAIPEDAPTHIYFFIEDLFFTAKIQEVAKQQGVKVAFMKPDKDVVAHLAELHDHEHPSLIVFDLNNAAAKPLTLIPKLKNKLKKGTSILGFLSHLQGDLKQKAVEAGCHTVMPRSAFSQNLPNLLRRYGVDEADEPNFNQ